MATLFLISLEIKKTDKVLLFNLAENIKGVSLGVKDTFLAFLKNLEKHTIVLGSKISLISREDFDDSMVVKTKNTEISISQAVADNLFVNED